MMKKKIQNAERGFSLIELLAVVGIIGILLSVAMVNFQSVSQNSWDISAQADYKSIKSELFATIASPGAPNTIRLSRQLGPGPMGAPLDAVVLSEDTEAVVNYTQTYRRSGNTINIQIQVWNRNGAKEYRYTDINGTVTEQVITR